MSTLNNRIKERRLSLGLTLLEVADMLGVKEATAQRYESGKIKNIKHETILKLSEILHCEPSFLMGWTEETNKKLPKNIIPLPKTKKVPLLGNIACGKPITAIENIDEYIDVDGNINCTFALKCKGDSMINARIFENDIVFIREQPDVEEGEIAAVCVNDEATLKRVYKYPDKIILRAENPLYNDLVYSNEELNEIRILGKAVAFLSAIR